MSKGNIEYPMSDIQYPMEFSIFNVEVIVKLEG